MRGQNEVYHLPQVDGEPKPPKAAKSSSKVDPTEQTFDLLSPGGTLQVQRGSKLQTLKPGMLVKR